MDANDEKNLRSLSVYSFSSESDTSSLDPWNSGYLIFIWCFCLTFEDFFDKAYKDWYIAYLYMYIYFLNQGKLKFWRYYNSFFETVVTNIHISPKVLDMTCSNELVYIFLMTNMCQSWTHIYIKYVGKISWIRLSLV